MLVCSRKPPLETLTNVGARARTLDEEDDARTRSLADAADLARLDDDGGLLANRAEIPRRTPR